MASTVRRARHLCVRNVPEVLRGRNVLTQAILQPKQDRPTDPTARPHDDILSQHPDAAQTLVLSAVLNSGARNFSKFIYTFPQANGEKTSKLGRFGHESSEIACYDFSNPRLTALTLRRLRSYTL